MMAKAKKSSKKDGITQSEVGNRLVMIALRLLQKHGPMSAAQLISKLQGNPLITAALKEPYSDGNPKWLTSLRFQSLRYTKAGLLRKEKRIWSLTEDGKRRLGSEANDDIIEFAREKYSKWASVQRSKSLDDSDSSPDILEPVGISDDGNVERQKLESRARAGIREFVQKMDPYEFQDLVAALLRAMGYFTPSVAAPGPDGGVDIIAYEDPLGASGVRLKVQVKRYKASSPTVKDVQALQGLLTEDEAGVFVCASDFSRQCRNFARDSAKRHLRLIDGNEFIRLWIEFHPKMRDEDKKRLPLYAVHFLDEETIPD